MSKIFFDKLRDSIGLNKIKNLGNFWFISWYGRSTWDKDKGITLKEVVLINLYYPNYYFLRKKRQNDYSLNLLIEEHYTREIPLGAILNEKGEIVRIPQDIENDNIGLYSPKHIEISEKNYCNGYEGLSLIDYLLKSNYPLQRDNLEMYNNCPFYKTELLRLIKNDKDNSEEKKYDKTILLIPIHVILQTFYYLTNYSAHKLLNDENVLDYIKLQNDQLIISSQKIKIEHAKYIGMYYFVEENYGITCLKHLKESHKVKWLKNQLKTGDSGFEFVVGLLPFPITCKTNVTGVYLNQTHVKDNNENDIDKIFLVLSMDTVRPYSYKDTLFESLKFNYLDLDDRTTTEERNSKKEIEYNAKVIVDKVNEKIIESTNLPTNLSLSSESISSIINAPFEFPSANKIKRTDQISKYSKKDSLFIEKSNLSMNINEYDSKSETQRLETFFEKNEIPFQCDIFKDLISLLNEEYKCSCEILYFNTLHFNMLTESPVKTPKINMMCIFQVVFKNSYYTIIDTLEGNRIAIFRNSDNTKYLINNDTRLTIFIRNMIEEYNYNWSKIHSEHKDKLLNQFGVKVLRPFNHKVTTKFDKKSDFSIRKIAEKYCGKIVNAIENDLN